VRQLLQSSLAVVMQHAIVLLCTFAVHMLMRCAAAQVLYIDSLEKDLGNKRFHCLKSKFVRPVKFIVKHVNILTKYP